MPEYVKKRSKNPRLLVEQIYYKRDTCDNSFRVTFVALCKPGTEHGIYFSHICDF